MDGNETMTIGGADVANVPQEPDQPDQPAAADGGTATGEGAAHDASVQTESNVTRLERELSEARAEEEAAAPQRVIDAAELAVETAKNQLAWAEDALRQAKEDVVREAEDRQAAEEAKAATAAAEAEAAATPTETEGK